MGPIIDTASAASENTLQWPSLLFGAFMKLTLARPDHSETIANFYQKIYPRGFDHPEMLDARLVDGLLADGEIAVVIATHKRSLLGCGLAFISTWNQALEIGPLSVDQIEGRGAVGKALFEAMRRLGLKNYGVCFYRASGEKSFQRGRNLGASCWGYRPAPGSNKLTDAELIMGFPHPGSEQRRVEPPANSLTRTPFAARVIRSFEGAEQGVPHPKSFPVGCPRGTGAPVISGRIWPTYHSRGNYIHIENAAGAYPVEIIKEFTEKVEEKGVRDVRLALPVNQEEAFFDLLDYGFRPVAYLPGWYLRGAHRFDCVQLVRGAPRVPRTPETFIERAVQRAHNELTPE